MLYFLASGDPAFNKPSKLVVLFRSVFLMCLFQTRYCPSSLGQLCEAGQGEQLRNVVLAWNMLWHFWALDKFCGIVLFLRWLSFCVSENEKRVMAACWWRADGLVCGGVCRGAPHAAPSPHAWPFRVAPARSSAPDPVCSWAAVTASVLHCSEDI